MKIFYAISIFASVFIVFGNAFQGIPGVREDYRSSPQLGPGFAGDMKLTKEQQRAIDNGEDAGPNVSDRGYAASNKVTHRWPNAVIPYNIDCSLENMPSALAAIKAAMAEWESKTCIRFVKHTNEKDYLTFFRDTHCWGHVGRIGGESKISVGDGCDYQHVMSHEIGHTVGFYHEQNRMDRDSYVDVKWDNIDEWVKSAFKKVKESYSLGEPYDYASIMHYPWTAFSKNGKDTMTPLRQVTIQPYKHVSQGDSRQTSRMYSCANRSGRKRRAVADCRDNNKSCSSWAKAGYCSSSSYVAENCELSCKAPHCDANFQCVDQRSECKDWEKWGHCTLNPTVMKLCPKSCNPKCKVQPPTTPSTTDKPTTGKKTGVKMGIGILCRDRHSQCADWAKRGECSSNPGWMQKNCKVSCKQPDCDMTPQKPSGSCSNPLGIGFDGKGWKIPDSSITATSALSPGSGWAAYGHNARLYYEDDHDKKRIGAWCVKGWDDFKAGAYLEVDLGSRKNIKYIATQGRHKYFERVSKFKVKYSNDRRIWRDYTENGRIRQFEGNCDHFTPILNTFNNIISARYFRYYPTEANYPCVRLELYGC